jgi:GNAT superfamily N-acetyltransferase
MYTLPAWRQRGIGTALLETALSDAREAGITCVRLHATKLGRHVYEKLGFVPEDSEMVKTW